MIKKPEALIQLEAVIHDSGNMFAVLDFDDADERQTKRRLAHTINQILEAGRHSQATAANLLKVDQAKISALQHYKLEGFTVERLMSFLTAMDRDIEISIRKKPQTRPIGMISVSAV
jgi:predicted XRE-type DNA-binding protein